MKFQMWKKALNSSLEDAWHDIDCRLVYDQEADSTGQVMDMSVPPAETCSSRYLVCHIGDCAVLRLLEAFDLGCQRVTPLSDVLCRDGVF